jgi:hypothetical protein
MLQTRIVGKIGDARKSKCHCDATTVSDLIVISTTDLTNRRSQKMLSI